MLFSSQIILKTVRPKGDDNTHWRWSWLAPRWACCLLHRSQPSLIKLCSIYLSHSKGSRIHGRLAECANCRFGHNLVSEGVCLDYLLGWPQPGCKNRGLGFHPEMCNPRVGTEQQPAWKQHLGSQKSQNGDNIHMKTSHLWQLHKQQWPCLL